MTLTKKGIARIKSFLPWKAYFKLRRRWEECRAMISDNSLTSLAKIYRTDKWGKHRYTPIYEQWFSHQRKEPVRLLEIGVGGHDKAHAGGNSLRMWKRYFPKGEITGIDIHPKQEFEESRIHIYTGDQADPDFLRKVHQLQGPFDIIIDDGSHVQSHILASFQALFPLLKPLGTYIIEDTATSYWPKFEGSTSHMNEVPSAMNYFIRRVHQVNRNHWIREDLPPDISDEPLESISFYHNLIIITKAEKDP